MTAARAALAITVALILSLASAFGCSGASPTPTPTAAISSTLQRTDLTVAGAKDLIASTQDLTVLDVRTQSEYDSGHIAGARLIPVTELEGRLGELQKANPILVYCRTGSRSLQASQILVSHQFEHVYNMMGGITAWTQANYPVTQ